jgi:hypothetical protein
LPPWFTITDLPEAMVAYIREAITAYHTGDQASLTFYGW